MAAHWQDTTSALGGIAQESRGQAANSFEICFARSNEQRRDVSVSSSACSACAMSNDAHVTQSPAAVGGVMRTVQPIGTSSFRILSSWTEDIDVHV